MKKMPDADPTTLWVHSIFPTIQGEGIFAGVPAVFLRLGGCNLQCPFCDTDYTEGSEWMQGDQIVYLVRFFMPRKANLVVITGGEPMRQKLGPLIKTLNENI